MPKPILQRSAATDKSHAAAVDGTYLDPAIARRLTGEITAPRSGLNALTASRTQAALVAARGGLLPPGATTRARTVNRMPFYYRVIEAYSRTLGL